MEINIKELEPDRDHLDAEWSKQSSLYMYWSELSAKAQREVKDFKRKLDLVEAELDVDIRKDPKKYGLEKITESAIHSIIIQEEAYNELFIQLLDKEEEANILQGGVRALDHKKSALQDLVQLWMKGYWSEPFVPQEAKNAVGEVAREEQQDALSKSPRLRRRT